MNAFDLAICIIFGFLASLIFGLVLGRAIRWGMTDGEDDPEHPLFIGGQQ